MTLKGTLDALSPETDWSAVCSELESMGIASPASLAFHDERLQSAEHRRARDLVLTGLSTPPISINAQRRAERRARDWTVQTSIGTLDEIVGGLQLGQTVEVSGARASGKTHLALLIVLNHLRAHPDVSAAWISTETRFAPEWAMSVLRALEMAEDVKPSTPEASQALDDRLITVLDRLKMATARTADDVAARLSEIRQAARDGPKLEVAVIDPVTPLYTALSSESAKGHALMVSSLRFLTALARSPDMPFLLIVSPSADRMTFADHQFGCQRSANSAFRQF